MRLGAGFDKRVINTVQFIWSKLFHRQLSCKTMQAFMQFVHFGMVGFTNTVISYVIYVGALVCFQKKNMFVNTDYLVAQFIAFVLSVLWSFCLNRRFVFDDSEKQIVWYQALIKTYISYATTGLVLTWILSYLWVEVVGMSKIIAPIINLLITVPLNFVLNKFWAFKK